MTTQSTSAAKQVKAAFRYELAPSSIGATITEALDIPKLKRFYVRAACVVVFLHAVVFIVKPQFFFNTPPIGLEEAWEVNMDLLGDVSSSSPNESALPNAEKALEEAIPANLLPQLPKKFQIEAQEKADGVPDSEKDIAASENEKQLEKASEQTEAKPTEEDANKVDMDDLRKRLAVEKLKEEQKTSDRIQAQKDALAKLKDMASKTPSDSNSGTKTGALSLARSGSYGSILASTIKKSFYLPESFKHSQAKLSVPVIMVIDDKGELLSVKLSGTSGNDVYDQAAIASIRNSTPLPKPPKELANEPIQFNFNL
jgi:protein TonB